MCGTNVGVKDIGKALPDIQVYPLPAHDMIYVDLPNGYDNAIIQLTDISGRPLVVKEDNCGLRRELDLDRLEAGIYLLQVTDKAFYKCRTIIHN